VGERLMKITIVSNGADWEALYIDGKRKIEGHQIEVEDVLQYIKSVEYDFINREISEDIRRGPYYPDKLEDIE
jgi:hypothetical protein